MSTRPRRFIPLAEAVQFLRLLHAGEKAKAAKLAKEVA